ncbi:hypothetical protein CAPTEDRAFT_140887, partial [Capitella teleta]
MTDVTLKLPDDSSMPCHKLLLIAASPFFETMFQSGMKESVDQVVELKFSDADTIRMLVEFIYSGEIDVNKDNVRTIIAASEFLLLKDLKAHCENFIVGTTNSSNCIQNMKFGRKFNLEKLISTANQFMVLHFEETLAAPEFNSLTEAELREVVSNDQLNVEKEDVVFHAVVGWVNADLEQRKEAFPRIAPLIRFPFCSPETLNGVVGREPLMWNHECMKLLTEAQ